MENRLDVHGDVQGISEADETPEGLDKWHYHNKEVVGCRVPRKSDSEAGFGERLEILLVDDDRCLCDSLAALLRVVGYNVVNVYAGLEALAAAEIKPFDAAVIDIVLPDIEGNEVLRRLQEADPEIGILILSEAVTLEDAIRSLNLGADAFALKPSDPDVLLSKVRKVARLGRLQRGLDESKAGYRDFFENIGDGAFQSDLEGNFTAMNQAGAEILGFDGPKWLLDGRIKVWETYSLREEYEALMMGVLKKGEAHKVVSRFRKRDRTLGWLETTFKTRKGTDGAVIGFEGIFRDVTERIKYLEMLEALYYFWADLSEVEAFDEIGELTLEFLRATLGIDGCGFAVVDRDVITWMGRLGERELHELPAVGQRLVSRAVYTGEVQMVPDTRLDGDCSKFYETEGEGILSVIVVPVKLFNEAVASIDIGSSEPDAFNDEDRMFVEIVGERIASAMARLIRSKFGIKQSWDLSDFM